MPAIILRFLPHILGALFLVGLFFAGYMHGYDKCQVKNAKADAAIITEGIKTNENVQHKVMQLSDHDLDKRLLRWLRD